MSPTLSIIFPFINFPVSCLPSSPHRTSLGLPSLLGAKLHLCLSFLHTFMNLHVLHFVPPDL